MKKHFKGNAIALRRKGLSYSEILETIPVAKSTLSLWLQSVGLSKKQKQRLTRKKLLSMKRGWLKAQRLRLENIERIKTSAQNEVPDLLNDPFWLLGVVLYWGEGTKEKVWRKGEKLALTNMDSDMLWLYKNWIKKYLNIGEERLRYELYIHENADIKRAYIFWEKALEIPSQSLRVYFKKDKGNAYRKNRNVSYNGVLRIWVVQGADLNRKIAGWIAGVVRYFSK